MRLTFLLLALASSAFGQIIPTRVKSEEAEKHLVKRHSPIYPQLAQQTRVSGNVLLEISIDPSGKTSVGRVISGHPLLVPAAIAAVNSWHFQQFLMDGQAATVVTAVIVTFGDVGIQNQKDRVELAFQYDFGTADSLAQAALEKGDFVGAEEELKKAAELLAPVSDEPRNSPERRQLALNTGDLRRAQQRYDEAEQSYRKVLELLQGGDREDPEIGEALARLGRLYVSEKRFDLARDQFSRSITIYRKDFKRAGSSNPGARQAYGESIAYGSWMLSRIELQINEYPKAVNECRDVLEFQSFLKPAHHDSIVSGCQQTISGAGSSH